MLKPVNLFVTCCAVISLLLTGACERAGTVVESSSIQEGGDTTATNLQLEYLEVDLPERDYLVFRQELALQDMNGFLAIEADSLMRKTTRAGVQATGPMTSLFYVWDPAQGYGDAAVAVPVEKGTKLPPYATITLPARKALAIEFDGPYDRLSAYHFALGEEIKRRGLKAEMPSIEEYPVGPIQTTDPSKFSTRILYPYTQAQ